MKFSRPAITLLTGAMLLGVVACGGDDDRVSNANDRDDTSLQSQLAETASRDSEFPAFEERGVAQPNPNSASQNPAALSRDQQAALQSDLSTAAIESGVIPEELVGEDSVLNRLAIARLEPTAGNQVSGLVSFIETEGESGIRIIARVAGLSDGDHGIHVHENGDCSGMNASSAGDHFNPGNDPHAAPDADNRHAGDLGNINSRDQQASLDITDDHLSFRAGNSVVGRAVIVHAGQDDLSTQPGGDAGDPVACGVIMLQDASAVTRY